MEDEALPLPEGAAPPVDGEEIFLNGTLVSEATFQVLWAAQQGKTCVQWYNWSEAAINETFSAELEARALYRDFFRGETSIAANAVDYGDPTGESRFRAPDIYTSSAVAGNLVDRTIKRFALSDLDGDGVSELILALRFQDTDAAWDDDYAILTCYDGTLYASERVFRGFLYPRADGTYEFSGGLYDNGVARACFKNGVMYDEETAIELPEGCQLNGETVSAETFSAFLALQGEKPELTWMALTEENLTAALGA